MDLLKMDRYRLKKACEIRKLSNTIEKTASELRTARNELSSHKQLISYLVKPDQFIAVINKQGLLIDFIKGNRYRPLLDTNALIGQSIEEHLSESIAGLIYNVLETGHPQYCVRTFDNGSEKRLIQATMIKLNDSEAAVISNRVLGIKEGQNDNARQL